MEKSIICLGIGLALIAYGASRDLSCLKETMNHNVDILNANTDKITDELSELRTHCTYAETDIDNIRTRLDILEASIKKEEN